MTRIVDPLHKVSETPTDVVYLAYNAAESFFP